MYKNVYCNLVYYKHKKGQLCSNRKIDIYIIIQPSNKKNDNELPITLLINKDKYHKHNLEQYQFGTISRKNALNVLLHEFKNMQNITMYWLWIHEYIVNVKE